MREHDPRYAAWIVANVGESNVFGMCVEYTLRMLAAFPELTRVRGHYHDPVWGPRAHWWLVDPDGRIVDPTAAQFPSKGAFEYEPWIDGAEEPCGRCANCGDECFRSKGGNGTTCSGTCHDAYTAYLMGGKA